MAQTFLFLRTNLELHQIQKLLFLLLLDLLWALGRAIENKPELVCPPLVLLDLINLIDLGLFQDLVLFKLVLHMDKHHHSYMIAPFNQSHLLLEVLAAVEL